MPGSTRLVPRRFILLPGSTIQVAREHDSGCPGARFWLPGSMIQVAWKDGLAFCFLLAYHVVFPQSMFFDRCWEHDPGCPGARFVLPGSTISSVILSTSPAWLAVVDNTPCQPSPLSSCRLTFPVPTQILFVEHAYRIKKQHHYKKTGNSCAHLPSACKMVGAG